MGKPKLRTAYLYPDNHAVLVFEQYHTRSGETVTWAEVVERFVESGIYERPPEGRVILDGRLAPLVRKARHVRVHRNNNTPAAEKRGIVIHSLVVHTKDGEFTMHDLPEVISGDFCYQDRALFGGDIVETFQQVENVSRWSDHNVTKVHRVEKEPTTV